ncbi:MAG: GNAT family N-acetyltransferase [Lentisphaeraceae bacterium]|nr:GNAT family N-acetyltransferase [Lentisphaeraceae bacterium]
MPQSILDKPLVKVLSWDTKYFGFNVAQINGNRVCHQSVKNIVEFCEKENVNLLQFKCDAHHSESVKVAEENDFHFVDIRMTFEISLIERKPVDRINSLEFRLAGVDDLPVLMKISHEIYQTSRYHFDSNFPKEKVDLFYQDWVRKAVTGDFDDCLYVITLNKIVLGYCSIRRDGSSKAFIGIVGLDDEYRGNGYGKELIEMVLDDCKRQGIDTIDVVTQGRNYSAQRLYQRCGMLLSRLELYYHKWL